MILIVKSLLFLSAPLVVVLIGIIRSCSYRHPSFLCLLVSLVVLLQDVPKKNKVRFTPVQVEAIRSGMNPGLTMVVGPPGTGAARSTQIP